MLHIHLFGHLRLFLDGRPQKFSALPKTIPLLAYLLLHQQLAVPRDTLAFVLWPDVSESEARANLRRHLHELRRNLPPTQDGVAWVLADTQQVQWNPAAAFWLDLTEFNLLSQQPERLAEAAALYTGDLLQAIDEEWLTPERERLRGRYLHILEQLIERCQQQHDLAQGINYCQQALHYDPWQENIIRQLMRLRLTAGDRAGALQEYQRFKQRLDEDLGVAPMPETRALYQEMVDNRLKTPPRPQPPPPAVPMAAEPPRHNLPAPLMACIGREAEIAALTRLFTGPETIRLITLTGPGGIGKTRLALELTRHLWDSQAAIFPDGIFYVPLANIEDGSLIAPAIAEAIGLTLNAAQSRSEQVKKHLADKTMLLWLDNFEQLAAAAPQLTELLAAAANLRLLVTSQAILHVYGEHEFPVPPLATPQADLSLGRTAISQTPAVAWFITVARAANPAFTLNDENIFLIAQICARLEGMPLAIELAAARSKLFPLSSMLIQLNDPLTFLAGRSRDLPTRQRTLRQAIGWSHNLLTESEKQLFAALAVFAGTFSLAAAVAVAADEGGEGQVYNDLESLLDKSMIRLASRADEDEPRFRMLTVIRHFAREQLDAAAAARYHQRHLAFFTQLTVQAHDGLYGPEQLMWRQRLTQEDDNIRVALGWGIDQSGEAAQVEMATSIICNLAQRYWQLKGRITEGRDWIRRALVHRQLLTPVYLMRLLHHGGWLAQLQEDYVTALPMHEEGLALARQLAEPHQIVLGLHYLGAVAGRTGDYVRSETVLLECLAMMRQDKTTKLSAISTLMNNIGLVQRRLKKYDEAAATLLESATLKQQQGDSAGLAGVYANLGMVRAGQKRYDEARTHLNESLRLRHQINDRMGMVFTLQNMGELAALQQQWVHSIQLIAACQSLRQEMNLPFGGEAAAEHEQWQQKVKEQVGEAGFAAAWQEGKQTPLAQIVQMALADTPEAIGALPTQLLETPQRPMMPVAAREAQPAPQGVLPFVAQELIAVGGMGEVYKGVLAATGETVAIKRLKPELIEDNPELLLRFSREAEALRQLNHPNIVQIITATLRPPDPYIIMEYVPGGSLHDLLSHTPQPPISTILRVGLELADALTRAHHLGIIHRDLKPANVLLAADGSVRLTDFGIAYLNSQEQKLTQAGAVIGTASYLSPEACLGEPLDARSDIWSFGVILAEMVTGENPFAGSNFTTTVSAVIHKPLPNLRPHRPDAPPALFTLLEQMLHKDRAQRISSSRQVAAALERIHL